jgi:hypothetical protein
MTEDGWVSAGYPDSDYFYFRAEEHGGLTYLFHESRAWAPRHGAVPL